jgi:predicted transcriptional regulator
MSRLNLTLDPDTNERLDRHATELGSPRAAIAREILREGLARRERLRFRQRLARAYAADRKHDRALLGELEAGQLELMGEEDA